MAINFKKAAGRLSDFWQELTLQEVLKVLKSLAILAIILILIGFYFLNKGEERVRLAPPEARDVHLSDEALNRDLDARVERKVQAVMDKFIRSIDTRLGGNAQNAASNTTDEHEDEQSKANDATFSLADDDKELDDIDKLGLSITGGAQNNEGTGKKNDDKNTHLVGGATQVGFGYPEPPNSGSGDVDIAPVFVSIGGISTTQISAPKKNTTPPTKKTTFQIPVGFMPAKLLVGVRAQTSSDGASNPKPVHFRVQAPATLPNKVRMNLQGCFVIANTWGNLATERIEAELKSLHCISRDKKILIEGDIHGYLADTDGQRDMHGRVVTKQGAILSRTIIADILGGVGKATADNAGTTQTSALGTVKTLDGKSMYKAGLSSGVSSGFNRTAEFLSNLLVQSAPIVESGAAKDVVLMIQKTSEIEIKTLNVGEF